MTSPAASAMVVVVIRDSTRGGDMWLRVELEEGEQFDAQAGEYLNF